MLVAQYARNFDIKIAPDIRESMNFIAPSETEMYDLGTFENTFMKHLRNILNNQHTSTKSQVTSEFNMGVRYFLNMVSLIRHT